MVKEWGMSEKYDHRVFRKDQSAVFLGRELGQTKDHSEALDYELDQEINTILKNRQTDARTIIQTNMAKLHRLAEFLIEHESANEDDIMRIFHEEATP